MSNRTPQQTANIDNNMAACREAIDGLIEHTRARIARGGTDADLFVAIGGATATPITAFGPLMTDHEQTIVAMGMLADALIRLARQS